MKITEITESINFYDRFGHDTGAQALPYTVEVRDRETGGKKLISIQAVSAADARERARDRGYRVVRVVSQDESVEEGHADQQRTVVKRNGQPVGEIGIDRESSPGVGQYYMKHYASGTDLSGYSSREEALDDLRHIIKQGVREDRFDLLYRLERLDPQTRRVLTRMADHKEPGSWLSASEAYALTLGLQYKSRDPRGWKREVQHYVDLWREITGKKS